MSNLNYLHKVLNQTFKNGVSETYEESIIDGPRGITIKLFKVDATGVKRILISGKDDKFTMKTKKRDKEEEKTLSKDELLSVLNTNKSLKFASEYVKTQKDGTIQTELKELIKKKGQVDKRKQFCNIFLITCMYIFIICAYLIYILCTN